MPAVLRFCEGLHQGTIEGVTNNGEYLFRLSQLRARFIISRTVLRKALAVQSFRKIFGFSLFNWLKTRRRLVNFDAPIGTTVIKPKSLVSLFGAERVLGPVERSSRAVKIHCYESAVLAGRGAVGFDSKGRLIQETVWRSSARIAPALSRLGWRSYIGAAFGFKVATPNHIDGSTVSLASNWDHYGHWVPEHLLKLADLQGHSDFKEMNFIIRGKRGDYKHQFLQLLGISEDQILLWNPRNPGVKLEKLLVPTYPELSREKISWVRNTFASEDGHGLGPRIYLSREQNNSERILGNRFEVEDILNSMGFATFHPQDHPIENQIAVFRNARLIFGLHGSAFANLIFCKPGATVIEAHGDQIRLGFWELAIASGLEYRSLVSKDVMFRRKESSKRQREVFVDPVELKKALEESILRTKA